MKRPVTLRTLFASIALTVLGVVLAFQLGLFDPLVRWRAHRLAWSENEWIGSWYGIQLNQYPNDLMIYQELVYRLKPDLIIETGSDYGANALYLSTLLDHVNPNGRIVTIDIDARHWNEAMAKLDVPGKDRLLKRIQFIESDSLSPTCIAEVSSQAENARCVLILLDSLHTKKQVLGELRSYAPLVTPGSYVIVNDTQLEGLLKGDRSSAPLASVREFLAECSDFEIDHEVERFNVTCARSGFLRRIK